MAPDRAIRARFAIRQLWVGFTTMPAPDPVEERANPRLAQGLLWAGVGLAPLAALLLLLGGSTGLLRFAVFVVLVSIALIGTSVALRGGSGASRVDLEEVMVEEMVRLRAEVRSEIANATRVGQAASNQRLQALGAALDNLQAQLAAVQSAAEPAQPAIAAPAGRAAIGASAAVPAPPAAEPSTGRATASVSVSASAGYARAAVTPTPPAEQDDYRGRDYDRDAGYERDSGYDQDGGDGRDAGYGQAGGYAAAEEGTYGGDQGGYTPRRAQPEDGGYAGRRSAPVEPDEIYGRDSYRTSYGDDRASHGDDRASRGDDRASRGDDRASRGDDRASRGDDRASRGDDRASRGDDRASRGDDRGDRGDRARRAGDDYDSADRSGYDRSGYDRDGYDRDGYDRDGYGRDGYGRDGYGRNRQDEDRYDRAGRYDASDDRRDRRPDRAGEEPGRGRAGVGRSRGQISGGLVRHTETVHVTTRSTIVDPRGDSGSLYGTGEFNGPRGGYGDDYGRDSLDRGRRARNFDPGARDFDPGYRDFRGGGYGTDDDKGYGGDDRGDYDDRNGRGDDRSGYGDERNGYGDDRGRGDNRRGYASEREESTDDVLGRRAARPGQPSWGEQQVNPYDRPALEATSAEPSWSQIREAGDRYAAVRQDDRGQELRVGERRASVHTDESGSELRVEDRWESVRREDRPNPYDRDRRGPQTGQMRRVTDQGPQTGQMRRAIDSGPSTGQMRRIGGEDPQPWRTQQRGGRREEPWRVGPDDGLPGADEPLRGRYDDSWRAERGAARDDRGGAQDYRAEDYRPHDRGRQQQRFDSASLYGEASQFTGDQRAISAIEWAPEDYR
ncbi:hypothetical protein JCM9534A_47310 [Catenuloplanes indicus JCM 9534]